MSDWQGRFFHYRGRSMWPCFQDSDLLEIVPVDMARIRIGDCLVFLGEKNQHVVHRVISTGEALKTRGDAMRHADEQAILQHKVIGRVVSCHRMGRKIPVANGLAGRLAGHFFRFAGRIDPQRQARGGQLARWIQRLSSVVLRPIWHRGRVQTLQRVGDEPVVVWGLGQIMIGRQSPIDGEWATTWPWKVFVKLPEEILSAER